MKGGKSDQGDSAPDDRRLSQTGVHPRSALCRVWIGRGRTADCTRIQVTGSSDRAGDHVPGAAPWHELLGSAPLNTTGRGGKPSQSVPAMGSAHISIPPNAKRQGRGDEIQASKSSRGRKKEVFMRSRFPPNRPTSLCIISPLRATTSAIILHTNHRTLTPVTLFRVASTLFTPTQKKQPQK